VLRAARLALRRVVVPWRAGTVASATDLSEVRRGSRREVPLSRRDPHHPKLHLRFDQTLDSPAPKQTEEEFYTSDGSVVSAPRQRHHESGSTCAST
jgi:hypothetical protein